MSIVRLEAPETLMEASVTAADFVDATHGWIIGFSVVDGTYDRPLVWKTTDGRTWEALEIPVPGWPDAIEFIDARRGWIVAEGAGPMEALEDSPGVVILRTTDGGLTWSTTKNASMVAPGYLTGQDSLFFGDASHGWVVGSTRREHVFVVLRTDDGGATWREVPVTDRPIALTSITFADAEHGWISGYNNQRRMEAGTAFQTSDGGRTWRPAVSDSSPQNGLFRLDSAHLWSMHFPYQLLALNSQGTGWQPIGGRESGPDLFAFATPTIGWGIHFDRGEEDRVVGWHLLRTADAGDTWADCHVDLPDEPVDVVCPTADSVVVVTRSGTIATVSEKGGSAP